jgi:hypothetical protein
MASPNPEHPGAKDGHIVKTGDFIYTPSRGATSAYRAIL